MAGRIATLMAKDPGVIPSRKAWGLIRQTVRKVLGTRPRVDKIRRRPVPGGNPGVVEWGVCDGDWLYDVTNAVYANPSDIKGLNVDTDTQYLVNLLQTDMHDPNPRDGDKIGWVTNSYTTGGVTTTRRECVWGNRMQLRVSSVMLWPAFSGLPAGWQLADGSNGTRDLRSKFVVGYDSAAHRGNTEYDTIGNTGGADDHTHGNHDNIIGTLDTLGSGIGAGTDWSCSTEPISISAHSTNDHRPVYYVLAWIQRTS